MFHFADLRREAEVRRIYWALNDYRVTDSVWNISRPYSVSELPVHRPLPSSSPIS